jgi:phosphatidyl-myo-inositol dimannoside synthase
MRDPRVLLLTPDFPPARGGIQYLLHRVICNLGRLRTRVVTLPLPADGEMDLPLRCEVRRVGAWSGSVDRKASIASLNAWALQEALAFRPDVVLSGHIVVSPAAWAIARLLRVPYVQYVHASEAVTRPRLAGFACRHAAAVLAVSAYTRELICASVPDPARLHVVPPGVDLVPHRTDRRSPQPTVLTVARLEERYKGHDVMLRALPLVRARVPDARLAIVGDGSLRTVYEGMADGLGIRDAVLFLGALSNDERDRWFDASHVFVLPSRVSADGGEGFGIVYLEAGVHELPVVAGDIAGARDAVKNGVTGLLVDPTDHVMVAEAVSRLLADPGYAEGLGRAGAAHALDFAWPAIGRRVKDVLLQVAAERCR